MVNDCCFCLPLRTGSILIGVYFVVAGNFSIIKNSIDSDEQGEKNSDGDKTWVISLFLDVLLTVFGFVIILAACWMIVALLKACSVLVLVRVCFVVLFVMLVNSPFKRAGELAYYLTLTLLIVILNLYFAAVLWSYAKQLEAGLPHVAIIALAEVLQQPGENPGGGAGALRNSRVGAFRAGLPWSFRRPAAPPVYPGPPQMQQLPGPPSAPPAYTRFPPVPLGVPPHAAPTRTPVQDSQNPERPQ